MVINTGWALFYFLLMSNWVMAMVQEDKSPATPGYKEFMESPKPNRIPPDFWHFTPAPPPAPVVAAQPEKKQMKKKKKPKPLAYQVVPVVESQKPVVKWLDTRAAKLQQDAREKALKRIRLRQTGQEPLRVRSRALEDIREPEALYAKDPHYRYWDQRLGEERFTYPVDRDWLFTADRYISGILESGIKSSMPGEVIVVVDRPIFAAKGWKVIFPQGTRMICAYQGLSKMTDTRLSLNCKRAITPEGATLLFDSKGIDATGYPGLVGDIDYRTIEKYGSALVMSVIGAVTSAHATRSSRGNPVLQEASAHLTHNMGNLTAQVLEQYIDLVPVITIEPGTRIHLRPTTDIWLRQPLPRSVVQTWKTQQETQKQQQKNSDGEGADPHD